MAGTPGGIVGMVFPVADMEFLSTDVVAVAPANEEAVVASVDAGPGGIPAAVAGT